MHIICFIVILSNLVTAYEPGDGCCIQWNSDGTCYLDMYQQCCGEPAYVNNYYANTYYDGGGGYYDGGYYSGSYYGRGRGGWRENIGPRGGDWHHGGGQHFGGVHPGGGHRFGGRHHGGGHPGGGRHFGGRHHGGGHRGGGRGGYRGGNGRRHGR